MAVYSPEYCSEVRSVNDLIEVMRENHEVIHSSASFKNAKWECPCPGKKVKNKARINKIKQLYHCYSCGKGGNVFNYVMDTQHVSFTKAVEILAERADLPLPDDSAAKLEYQKRSDCYRLAMEYYKGKSTSYFKKRGLDPEDVEFFNAGYAPGGTKLKDHLIANGYDEDYLSEVGLINGYGKDTFFFRVVVPIYHNGRIVNFYGRRVDQNEDYKHHYINDSSFLMNIDEVKPGQTVILVESFFNLGSLRKMIHDNEFSIKDFFKKGVAVVATGGCTKFSQYHARLLAQKNVPLTLICYDTDLSGEAQQMALKTGKLLNHFNLSSRILEMPLDIDVNTYFNELNHPFEGFMNILRNCYPLDTYENLLWLRKIPKEMISDFMQGNFQ